MSIQFTSLKRREFLKQFAAGLAVGTVVPAPGFGADPAATGRKANPFKTRGVVLVAKDLTLADWPERAKRAGLTTLALHHSDSPGVVVQAVQSAEGRRFLEQCQHLGLAVEYELHAMRKLLPRELYKTDKNLFRMNDRGQRVPDCNLCPHSAKALEVVSDSALKLTELLPSTTGRYFFWGDDGARWCQCPECRGFSDSDQALIVENHLIKSLRSKYPGAQLAHLAYARTISAPTQVKPEPGVFLEFAPINRRYDIPYSQQTGAQDRDGVALLEANLNVFPAATAQVLEYWLDVGHWTGHKGCLPWHEELFLDAVGVYRSLGIGHVTSFGVGINADYLKRCGEPAFLEEYGAGLAG